MEKTYKVVKFIFKPDIDELTGKPVPDMLVRDAVTIKAGLTWQEAKELRKQNKGSEIIPEAIVENPAPEDLTES
jgi:hypothetical protein